MALIRATLVVSDLDELRRVVDVVKQLAFVRYTTIESIERTGEEQYKVTVLIAGSDAYDVFTTLAEKGLTPHIASVVAVQTQAIT